MRSNRHWWRNLAMLAVVGGVGCASGDPPADRDASWLPDGGGEVDGRTGLGFWEECVEHGDCESNICYREQESDEVGHCTMECDGICPDEFACRVVLIADYSDLRVCIPAEETFCDPCVANADCGDSGDFCVALTAGLVCTIDCSDDPSVCPVGFTCQTVAGTGDTVVGQQCMPTNGICCIDGDGDLRGEGSGCFDTDCDDDNPAVYDDADEVCDGFDNDCVGGVDANPIDCATAECNLGALGYYEIPAEPCEMAACTPQSSALCGLYTCADGGDDGDRCADACDGEDDGKCIPDAHCDVSVCYEDLPDGEDCDEQSDCESDHCQNEYCCDFGDCCNAKEECPTWGSEVPICNDPSTCQGTVGQPLCQSFVCVSGGTEPNDSACDASTESDDCDWYLSVYCNGAVSQTAPDCPSSCASHADCDPGGFCDPASDTCVEDRNDGEACDEAVWCKSGHCQNGFCCDEGDCCSGASDCPGSYSDPPKCLIASACHGTRNDAVCVDHECDTLTGVADDSACDSDVEASNCGYYVSTYCNGSQTQSPPDCYTSCTSDLQCDPDGFCNAGGACVPDQVNGQPCDDNDECLSGYCANGYCCDDGLCCNGDSACDLLDEPSTCNDIATCQGTRVEGACTAFFQCTTEAVDDDSGCDGELVSDCGAYLSVFCTDDPDQTAPSCASSCEDDGDCDPGHHCNLANHCAEDVPQGGDCANQIDCASGLVCADGKCCDEACGDLCEACDVSGHVGVCWPVPDGQDIDDECDGFECIGYYWGWGGDTCYRRATVTDTQATCQGDNTCLTQAEACPTQGQGPAWVTCDGFCQSPAQGTCTGTTPGSCDDSSLLCYDYSTCTDNVKMCVASCPTAPTEVCDLEDNDCDGSVDEGFYGDSSNGNVDFPDSYFGPTVASYPTNTSGTVQAKILPEGDEDWFAVEAIEDLSDFCLTDDQDEPIKANVTVTPPASGIWYEVCACWSSGTTLCGKSSQSCAIGMGSTSSTIYLEMDMQCMEDDVGYLDIQVTPDIPSIDQSCSEYAVSWSVWED